MHWPWSRAPEGEDEPGGSWVSIAARKRKIGQELAAALYIYDGRLFVCAVQWIAETGEAEILPDTVADRTLGQSICNHLVAFDPGGAHDLRNRKKTDWPAWRASGAKTVRQFEQSAFRLDVRTSGTQIALEAAPLTTLHSEMCVRALVSPWHVDIGAAARRVLRAAETLRQAGVV